MGDDNIDYRAMYSRGYALPAPRLRSTARSRVRLSSVKHPFREAIDPDHLPSASSMKADVKRLALEFSELRPRDIQARLAKNHIVISVVTISAICREFREDLRFLEREQLVAKRRGQYHVTEALARTFRRLR